jgi:Mn2+/Fe2+ NRAMP family transporter
MSKIKKYLASILPGIFLIGYNIGTGSITSMTKAGANFGLDLLWTLVLSCLITYFLMIHIAKFTIVTGKTAIQGIRDHIHPLVSIVLIMALSVIILTALIGVLGVVTDILQVWSFQYFPSGISGNLFALFIGAFLLALLWNGNTARFEKILAFLVAIMGIAFISVMVFEFPGWRTVMQGLVPSLPTTISGSDNGPMVILAGMVGTTVSTFVFVIRTQLVKEKGWTLQDQRIQVRDARISAILMFVISAAIMITATVTLHSKGIKLNHISEMVDIMAPIAGEGAMNFLVIGIVAAGLSSHLPNLLVIPWLVIDFKDEPRDITKTKYRIMLSILSTLSVAGVCLGFKSIFVLLLSQAFLSVVLPVIVASVFYLTARKDLMGSQHNGVIETFLLLFTMLFALFMSLQGLRGVIADLFQGTF